MLFEERGREDGPRSILLLYSFTCWSLSFDVDLADLVGCVQKQEMCHPCDILILGASMVFVFFCLFAARE